MCDLMSKFWAFVSLEHDDSGTFVGVFDTVDEAVAGIEKKYAHPYVWEACLCKFNGTDFEVVWKRFEGVAKDATLNRYVPVLETWTIDVGPVQQPREGR